MVKRNKRLIHKFLSRKLSKREKSKFLKKASTDKEFVKEFVKGIELNEVIEDEYGIDDTSLGENKKPNQKRWPFIILLSAAVFLISAFIISPVSNKQHTENLFHKYYEPIAASDGSQRGAVKTEMEKMGIGIRFYIDEEYESTIEYFCNLKMPQVYQKTIRFYLALSYMGIGDYSNAIELLESQIDENEIYIAESEWFLSLCYIKMNRINDAMELLTVVKLYSGLYHKPSKELLKKLKKIKVH